MQMPIDKHPQPHPEHRVNRLEEPCAIDTDLSGQFVTQREVATHSTFRSSARAYFLYPIH